MRLQKSRCSFGHVLFIALFLLFASIASGQPTITSFAPANGPVGTVLKITGTNLDNSSTISINGTNTIILSNTSTTVTCLVMPGTSTGIVSLSTPLGSINSTSNFTLKAVSWPDTQEAKLIGSGTGSNTYQGYSVAISADGNTVIAGGYFDNSNKGAAWVYSRTGSSWTQEAKLVGTGAIGSAYQGISVGISADGNTPIVGAYPDNSYIGAAWIFVRNGSSWSQQAKLVGTGNTGMSFQGIAVALSATGNTAVVGGSGDNTKVGAVWVFARNGTSWNQQGGSLIGSGGAGAAWQGSSVAISADGNTILSCGPKDNSNRGAVWAFVRSGSSWSQDGSKIVASDLVGSALFGNSVAINADGTNAVAGGPGDNSNAGAVWFLFKSSGNWNVLPKTTAVGAASNAQFGYSVSMNAEGNKIIAGGPIENGSIGAGWLFTRSGTTITQRTKISGSNVLNSPQQGISSALSYDGQTGVLGGPYDNFGSVGAAWIFISTSVPLPLKLISFSGSKTERGIRLEWITDQEVNTERFEVEYADNGVYFKSIGYILAKGAYSRKQFYEYDHYATATTNYYRLKMVDRDGSYSYSPILRTSTQSFRSLIRCYPNPACGLLTLEYPMTSESARLSIIDKTGRVIRTQVIQPGTNKTILDITRLAEGSYQVQLAGTGLLISSFVKVRS